MMLSYCMMLPMTICENLALVADDTGEGNWLEPFLNGSILKDRCDKCGSPIFRRSAATECGVDDQGLAGAILSYSWLCQQLLV